MNTSEFDSLLTNIQLDENIDIYIDTVQLH